MLEIGAKAPDFSLEGVDALGAAKTYRLGELLSQNKTLIVYFYPKDQTPGCTTEACDFRDAWIAEQDRVIVVGVSPDSLESHRKFQAKHGLNFPLLSDADHAMMTAYGVWGEKKLYGKTSLGVIRSTFVIAPDGTLRQAHRNVKVNGHAAKVLQSL
jgi:peroxiredoxin Q/BCP